MLNKYGYDYYYYFTLDDIFNNITPISYAPFSSDNFFKLINEYPNSGSVVPEGFFENLDETAMRTLCGNIYLKFSKFYCFNYRNDNTTEIRNSSQFIGWKRRLFSILVSTYEKYYTLLKIYNDNINKLMDKVKIITSGNNRFNDTPQNGGLFADDDHTTTITENTQTTESDNATIMERIREIQNNIRDVMDDWTNEFKILFINPLNI